jgi:hypothetical protein
LINKNSDFAANYAMYLRTAFFTKITPKLLPLPVKGFSSIWLFSSKLFFTAQLVCVVIAASLYRKKETGKALFQMY